MYVSARIPANSSSCCSPSKFSSNRWNSYRLQANLKFGPTVTLSNFFHSFFVFFFIHFSVLMQPSLFETNALTLNKNYNKVEKGIQEFQHKKGPAYESLRRRESTSDASHSFTTSERNMCKGIYCWASSLLSSYVIFRNIFSPTCGSTDFLPSLFSSRPVTPTVSHFLVSLQNNYFFCRCFSGIWPSHMEILCVCICIVRIRMSFCIIVQLLRRSGGDHIVCEWSPRRVYVCAFVLCMGVCVEIDESEPGQVSWRARGGLLAMVVHAFVKYACN